MRFPVDSAEVLISLCRAENQISSSWLTVASAHEMLAKCWPEIDDPKRHPPSLKKQSSENGHGIFQIWFLGQLLFKKKSTYKHVYIYYVYVYTYTN